MSYYDQMAASEFNFQQSSLLSELLILQIFWLPIKASSCTQIKFPIKNFSRYTGFK